MRMTYHSERMVAVLAFLMLLDCDEGLQVQRGVVPEDGELHKPHVSFPNWEDDDFSGCTVEEASLLRGARHEDKLRPLKIHVHLHKAGGTLMCHLAKRAGEQVPAWDWVYGANCNWMNHDDVGDSGFPERFPNCSTRRAAYAKHNWTYTQIERELTDDDLDCKDILYSVLVREPIELIESNINYEETENGGPGHTTGKNASMRVGHMRELLSKGLQAAGNHWDKDPGLQPTLGWKFMDNMQVRLLGDALYVPPGHVTKNHLEIAKRRLSKFNLVAKLEDFEDPATRDPILTQMGWQVSFQDDKCNAKDHKDPLTHADKAWLKNLNKWDYELYNWIGSA